MEKKSVWFVIPVLFFAGLLMYLVLWNLYYSFTDWSIIHPIWKFVGFKTYASVITTFDFKNSLLHSLEISAMVVALGNIMGLLFAGLVFSIKSDRYRLALMSLFVYPLTVSTAASSLIFLWLFNPMIGINWVLGLLHLPQPNWVGRNVIYSMVLIMIWIYSGLSMLFYLASFMNIDKSIIEAAYIDGASYFKIFRKILVPNSMNSFIVSTALLFIFSFRTFTLPYILTGGPTNFYSETLLTYQYYLFYSSYFAESAAVSTIVVLIALVVVVPYALLGMRRWVYGK